MVSYPNFMEACRDSQYPVLELLYAACDEANVRCSHVYLHRDPLEVLRSTTFKKSFNPTTGVAAAHLYTTMLKVIEAQLEGHPGRTRACVGFYWNGGGGVGDDDDDDGGGAGGWRAAMRKLRGWDDGATTPSSSFSPPSPPPGGGDDFESFLERRYKKPPPAVVATDPALAKFAANHRPYLDLFRSAHERTSRCAGPAFPPLKGRDGERTENWGQPPPLLRKKWGCFLVGGGGGGSGRLVPFACLRLLWNWMELWPTSAVVDETSLWQGSTIF